MKTTPNNKMMPDNDKRGAGYQREALLQALYEEPELAQQAAAERIKIKTNKKTTSKKTNTKTPSPAQQQEYYPNHIKAMMDDGIPVKQWIVLLLLLGAGAYQLRKAMLGGQPPLASTAIAGKRGKLTTKGKAKGKKGSKAAANGKMARAADIIKEQSPIEEDLALEQTVVHNTKKATKKKKTNNGKAAKKTTNMFDDVSASRTLKVVVRDSPDSVSTDGSSSTDGGGNSPQMNGSDGSGSSRDGVAPQNEKTPTAIMETTLVSDISDDAEGWHMVSKDKPSLAPPTTVESYDETPALKLQQQPEVHAIDDDDEPAEYSTVVSPNIVEKDTEQDHDATTNEQDLATEEDQQQQPEAITVDSNTTIDTFAVVPPVAHPPVQVLKPRKAKKANKSSVVASSSKVNSSSAAATAAATIVILPKVSRDDTIIISDEDLALMLQQEELRFASQMDKASNKEEDDNWEGVVVVTKRNKKVTTKTTSTSAEEVVNKTLAKEVANKTLMVD
jgi:hypothetical protein